MFDKDLGRYGDAVCLIDKERTFSYAEVEEICQSLENNLPNEKRLVFIRAKSNLETLIGYLVFLRSDMAFVMLDATLDEMLFDEMVSIYQPHYIWQEGIAEEDTLFEYNRYVLKQYNNVDIPLHQDLSLMLSTSGSTGSPKLVKLSKENIDANCNSIVEYLGINSSHRVITNLPFYYSYGLSVVNTHLAAGASIVISNESIVSKAFWEIFQKYKVTTLNGVPYNYEIFRRIGVMKMSLPSLRYMTQAGGKLNQKLVEEFALWADTQEIKFFVMYGQTEATARISYLPFDKTLEKSSSIGMAIPNGNLSIKSLKDATSITTPYIDGELVYEGKNVMLGYASSQSDLALGDKQKGVLSTGDIAHYDEDGYFYITGRLKRFIKIHGNRVGLDEVEQYLKSLSYDVLCGGVDNKLMIITLEDDKLIEIKEQVVQKYGFHHSVIKIKKVDAYPVLKSGKIEYKKILKEFV